MITFITSLRHPATAYSWERVGRLLHATLSALCQQTDPRFRIVVVCNELPLHRLNHPNIRYLEVDLPAPVSSAAELTRNLSAVFRDKGDKYQIALDQIDLEFSRYIMFFDYDDYLCRNLTSYLLGQPEKDVFVFEKGYAYKAGSHFVYSLSRKFQNICGSSLVFHTRIFQNPSVVALGKDAIKRNFLADHFKTDRLCHTLGLDMAPLPFPAALYLMANRENHSGMAGYLQLICHSKKSIGGRVRALTRLRLMTPNIAQQFGLVSSHLHAPPDMR